MFLGFRAGADPAIGVAADDFAGTRRAWQLKDGTAPIGRVFPLSGGAVFTAGKSPAQVVAQAEAACAGPLAAGMWPYYSIKPDVAQALAGWLDPHLTALGHYFAGLGVPCYFSVWHEPENDAMGAASTNFLGRAQNFVKVHTRAYQVVKEAAGDAVRMGPCHLVYKWAPRSPETADGAVADAWRVPADARDFIAADSYTSNWSWSTSGTGLRKKGDFQRWLTNVVGTDTDQIVVAERGISRTCRATAAPEEAQAIILRDDYAYLTELRAHGLLYWNSGGATDDSVFLLGAAGQAAFAEITADAATTTPTPTPQPAPDRYDQGYAAGFAAGRQEGFLAGRVDGVAAGRGEGRAEVLHDLGEWVATQAR